MNKISWTCGDDDIDWNFNGNGEFQVNNSIFQQ